MNTIGRKQKKKYLHINVYLYIKNNYSVVSEYFMLPKYLKVKFLKDKLEFKNNESRENSNISFVLQI